MIVWMLVTKDKYQLPIAIGDTSKELAKYVELAIELLYLVH